MSLTLRKILYVLAVVAVAALAAVLVVVYKDNDPCQKAIFPKCMFYLVTGYQCPGCGSQRAIHYFLNGEFWLSFKMNALLWLGIPYIIVVSVLKSPFVYPRFENLREILTGLSACIFWLVAIIGFWILRNVF